MPTGQHHIHLKALVLKLRVAPSENSNKITGEKGEGGITEGQGTDNGGAPRKVYIVVTHTHVQPTLLLNDILFFKEVTCRLDTHKYRLLLFELQYTQEWTCTLVCRLY